MPDEFDTPIRSAAEARVTRAAALKAESFGDFRNEPGPSLPVFVDVGSRKIESQIERDGVPIGVLAVNQAVLNEAILVRPILQVKVVSQSVSPGTPVPVGTTVDLVMAPPGNLPVGVITGVHDHFKDIKISDAFTALVADNPLVNRIVTHAAEGQLSSEDTNAVRKIFADAHAEVTDQPGTDINAAVATLAMLKTFGR
jgi:hypothetical protein